MNWYKMHSIHDTVNWINERILEIIPGGQVFGIAHTAKRGEELVPVVGETYVGIDDTFPFQAYHKQNTLTSANVPRTGYGDSENYLQNTYSNSLVIFFNYDKCNLTVDELYTFIQASITGILKTDGYRQVRVNVSSAILNDAQVWSQEYGNKEFRLDASQRLIQIGYSVIYTLDKNCITIPNCKN
jgi:hypothetical protein